MRAHLSCDLVAVDQAVLPSCASSVLLLSAGTHHVHRSYHASVDGPVSVCASCAQTASPLSCVDGVSACKQVCAQSRGPPHAMTRKYSGLFFAVAPWGNTEFCIHKLSNQPGSRYTLYCCPC